MKRLELIKVTWGQCFRLFELNWFIMFEFLDFRNGKRDDMFS